MRIATLLTTLTLASQLLAEHLPGGSITYACTGNNMYEVTMQLWRECSGTPMIAQDMVFSNDCGVSFLLNIPLISQEEVSPICADQQDETTCNGGSLIGIELYTYRTTLFLSPCDSWSMAWNTCCRNPSVNLVGTQGTYIEARLDNADEQCIISPVFTDDQPPYVCVDQPVSYDLGVIGQPGQTLRYHFIDARRQTDNGPPAVVEPVIYAAPYTGSAPFTGMSIDTLTGNISFLPTMQGYVVCAVEVSIYDDQGAWVGSVMRDFPFVVQTCTNIVPDATSGIAGAATGSAAATGPYEITACTEGSFCVDIAIADADAAQQLTLTSNVGLVLNGATFNVAGTNPATATVCWNTAGSIPGIYNFTITATDDACPTPGAQNYTYAVLVVEGAFGAGADSSSQICAGETIDLNTLVTGEPGGTWGGGPIVSTAGVYTYTVSSPCGDDVAFFTVSVTPPPNAGTNGSGTVCSDGGPFDLFSFLGGNPDPGGTWTQLSPSIFEYVVTNACGSDTATVVVSTVQATNAGLDNAITVCSNGAPFSLFAQLGGAPQAGGAWTFNGAPHPSIFDPTIDPPGIFCYTVNGTPPCADAVACITVNVVPAADAGLDNTIAFCLNAASFFMLDSLLGTPEAGGTWTAPDAQIHPPVFVPGVDPPGVYCYTVDAPVPCIDATACLTILQLQPTDPYCIGLGLPDLEGSVTLVTPNPSTGQLRIEGLRSACTRVDLLDARGRLLWSTAPNASSSFSLELPSTIASGSYALRIACADGSLSTQRIELHR